MKIKMTTEEMVEWVIKPVRDPGIEAIEFLGDKAAETWQNSGFIIVGAAFITFLFWLRHELRLEICRLGFENEYEVKKADWKLRTFVKRLKNVGNIPILKLIFADPGEIPGGNAFWAGIAAAEATAEKEYNAAVATATKEAEAKKKTPF